MIVAYGLSIRFVFQTRRATSRETEAAGFFAVGLAGLLLTQLLLYLFVSRVGMPVALSKIPTTGIVFAFNFLCRRGLGLRATRKRRVTIVVSSDALPAEPGVRATILDFLSKVLSTDGLVGVGIAILWALGHAFTGIEGDARIYMGPSAG